MTDADTAPHTARRAHGSPSFGIGEEAGGAPSLERGAAAVIRAASPADAPRLHELAAATFPLACPPDALPEAIEDFIAKNLSEASFDRYLADAERALFVAEVDGRAVGYTMLVFRDPHDADVAAAVTVRPTAELSKVYVLQQQHGGGVARQLVERSIAEARERGAKSLWLGVNQQNARANRFYEKSGFVVVGSKKFLVGERYEDDYVRALAL